MYNFYNHITGSEGLCRKLYCGESLVTMFNCGLKNRFEDLWSHYNYVLYVAGGRKIWHTAHGSYDLREGSCVFVRKGACVVEQFFDTEFCFYLFFVPDEFICEVLDCKSTPIKSAPVQYNPVIGIHNTASVQSFFQSMGPYFRTSREPNQALLKLKFTELILTIADEPANDELISYFCSLLKEPQGVSMQRIMEENFCYNLKLEEFAKLSSRSLSAFKRDFIRVFQAPPGKWLMEKRLNHAMHLLTNRGKTVSEAAFESGFENTSHFSKAFRLRFGMAPVAARQQIFA